MSLPIKRDIWFQRDFPHISGSDWWKLCEDAMLMKRLGYTYEQCGDRFRDTYKYIKPGTLSSILNRAYINKDNKKYASNNDRISC